MEEKTIDSLLSTEKYDPERGHSQLESPHPQRKKFITEVLAALAEDRITFAQIRGMDRKKMLKVAEQGYVKLKHGRHKEARKIFEILSFLDHKNYFHHLALGGVYQKLNKPLDAVFQYTQCLRYDPDNTNALVNRGEIFLKYKNFKKAAEDFREAITQDKNGRDLFANRARSLVIAIKRSLARLKGESLATKLPQDSPVRRKRITPLSLLSSGSSRRPKRK